MSNYNLNIKYRSGKKNADADGLSRCHEEEQQQVIFPEILKAISVASQIVSEESPLLESVALSDTDLSADTQEETPAEILPSTALSGLDWRLAQRKDPTIGLTIQHLKTDARKPAPQVLANPLYDARYAKDWDKLFLCNDILYRNGTVSSQEFRQLVVPLSFRDEIFKALHRDLGHQGRDRTTSLIKQRFYWPGIDSFIRDRVRQCDRCILRKKKTGISAELVNIVSTMPMEIVCVDYLSLERSKGGIENVLVITDHFSRYAQAYPTKNQTAKTTARVLFDQFIVHYGFPARIHSDQGQTFESNLIQELCKIAGVAKSRTTPYHAMGNGQVERFNQTLLQMLGTLEEYQKSDWKAHVPTLVHAYNATIHDSTGYSPYFLMFGRHPRLAIDAFLGLTPDTISAKQKTEYARKLKERLHFAYWAAEKVAKKSADKQKAHYDLKVRHSNLKPGDRVLVKNVGLRGKRKIADRWERNPYVVKSQPISDIPVYEVIPENPRARKTRLLHRILLLPFSSINPREDQRSSVSSATDDPSVALDSHATVIDIPPVDVLWDPPSDDSDDGYDAGISDCSQAGADTDIVDKTTSSSSLAEKYVIPASRKPGYKAKYVATVSATGSSSEDSYSRRPQWVQKKPGWMKSSEWVFAQPYTFTVSRKDVAFP